MLISRLVRSFLVLAVIGMAAIATPARAALVINFDTLAADGWTIDVNYWFLAGAAQPSDATVEGLVGYSPLSILYKANDNPVTEEGPYSGSYETVFVPANDAEDATISYVGGTSITESPLFLHVKDGNQGQYFFNITGKWDGIEDLTVENFWVGTGAISHVSIYGDRSTAIPEPASVAVWSAIGLIFGIGFYRRRRNQA